MKKPVILLLSLLMLSSTVFAGVPAVQAAVNPVDITGYSVSGVLGVPNVYAVTLNLRWTAPAPEPDALPNKLYGLQVEAAPGSDFMQAIPNGSGYTISLSPIEVSSSTLSSLNSSSGVASRTFYFLRSGADDSLSIKFTYEYGPDSDNLVTASSIQTIAVIKTSPDPTEPQPPTVDTSKYRPLIGVDGDAALPTLDQSTAVLTIPIRNSSSYTASKLTIQLEPVDKSKPIFTTNRLSVSASIDSLGANSSKNAQFNISLAPSATAGIHAVILNYAYQNSYGDSYTSSETAYIRVETTNATPRLSASPGNTTLKPGAESKVTFTIRNDGTSAARHVRVSLLGLSPAGVSVMRDVDVKYLDRIDGLSNQTIEFNLYTAPSLAESVTMLQVRLDYSDLSGVGYSETNTVFLPLGNGGAEGNGVPRLIISRYSMQPGDVSAGSSFLLSLDLRNTSQSKVISNLKVTILSDDGIFLPVNSSNTVFIERINPGAAATINLPMTTKADAENKPYSLRITFDYESSQGQGYNSQELITIPVRQNPRLVVGDPVFYGEAFAYQMLPVNVEFYNLGKTVLYNLMVKAEGPFQAEGGSYFVGNFNPGSSDSFNFAITPAEPGALSGAVVFAFEDSVGTPYEIRREFALNVMEPFVPEEPGNEPPPPAKKANWLLYGGIAVILLAAMGGGVFFFRRRKRLKLNLQNSEDLVAAARAPIPEIEYVGFDETDSGPKK